MRNDVGREHTEDAACGSNQSVATGNLHTGMCCFDDFVDSPPHVAPNCGLPGAPVSLCCICLQAVDTEVHKSAKELQQQLAAGMEQAAGGVADSQGRVQQLTVEHGMHSNGITQKLGEQSKVRRFTHVAVGLCSDCQAANHGGCHTCIHTCVSLMNGTVLATVCTMHTFGD